MLLNKSCIFLLIIIILISPLADIYAANSVQLVVKVTLSDGTPIAGVLINITRGNRVIASQVTDENGQAIFNLPGNEAYIVTASYGVWSEKKRCFS